MAKAFKGAGCGFEQVVQTRQDRRNDTDRTLLNQLDREYFRSPFPARTTITNCLPPPPKVEIECVGVVLRES